MAPKKKCYVFTVETRDAQAYLEPACIPPSDEDEWEDSDVEELDEEITHGVTIKYVENIKQVLKEALVLQEN